MKHVVVYDIDSDVIESLADANEVTEAEVIEAMIVALRDNGIDINEYL